MGLGSGVKRNAGCVCVFVTCGGGRRVCSGGDVGHGLDSDAGGKGQAT